MGQLTVYRFTLRCVCQESLLAEGGQCGRFMPYSQQGWPSFMGKDGDARFNVREILRNKMGKSQTWCRKRKSLSELLTYGKIKHIQSWNKCTLHFHFEFCCLHTRSRLAKPLPRAKNAHQGRGWYQLCICQPTLKLAVGSKKNIFWVTKQSSLQLVDNCTYVTIPYPF